ncbi:MAG: hypothetical protein WCL22_03205 [bacterium]
MGDAVLGDNVSLWFGTVVRGDDNKIRIGARTNVQDNSVIHVTDDTGPTIIGADVLIGHGCIVGGLRNSFGTRIVGVVRQCRFVLSFGAGERTT